MSTIELTPENEHLLKSGAAMVVCKAPWCGPCKTMPPVVELVAEQMAGKVKVFTLDTDAHQSIASRYYIRGLPTFMFMKDGQRYATQVGAATHSDLLQHCTNLL